MPMIFLSEYHDSFKQIVYYKSPQNAANNYVDFDMRALWMVDFKEYYCGPKCFWKSFLPASEFEKVDYAFGIMLNPYYTKMFVLDFDDTTSYDVEKLVGVFIEDHNVSAIDVVRSSKKGLSDSFHLYVGFNDYFNVCDLYRVNFHKACKGFIECARELQEVIVRVSDKKHYEKGVQGINGLATNTLHHSANSSSIPKMIFCLRKIHDMWYNLTCNNIKYPLTSTDTTRIKSEKLKIHKLTKKLDLRSKNGNDSRKQKIKRKETSTVSCIKDITTLPLPNRKGRKKSIDGSDWF